MGTHDGLDKAFDGLKARSRERAECNLDLEKRMMKEFQNVNRPRIGRFKKAAAVAVLCVTVAGAAVAATGGFSRILYNFTGTVETLDGDIYHIEDGKVVDDEGNVTGTMTVEILTD